MPTTLTNAGWNGEWTNGNDTIASTNGIVIDAGTIVNTLAGKDSITGTGGLDTSKAALTSLAPLNFGIANLGQIITGKNTDSLTGIATGIDPGYFVFGIYNEGSISLGNGSGSSIKGRAIGDGYSLGSTGVFSIAGIYNRSGTIAIGNGNNNSILGIGKATGIGLYSEGIFNRQGGVISIGNGNKNSITGIGGFYNGIYNRGLITMGNGNNNSITGIGTSTDFPSFTETTGAYGIYNQNVGTNPTIAIGNGDNTSITGQWEVYGCQIR